MKIAFHEIIGSEVRREITDDGWFPHRDVELARPVAGRLYLKRKGDHQVILTGNLQAQVLLRCDRCCRSVQYELSADFEYDCIVGKEALDAGNDTECREEDYYRLFINEPVIDLGEILKEQLYLDLPVNVLCRQSCKGLCHRCGADLNGEQCSCSSTDSSSPFAVLRQLKGD